MLVGVLTGVSASPADAATWTVGATGGGTQSAAGALSAPTATSSCVSALQSNVKVSWAAVSNAGTYTVLQSRNGAAYTTAISGVTTTSWTSGTLSAGSYAYKVTAFRAANWVSQPSGATATRTVSALGGCS